MAEVPADLRLFHITAIDNLQGIFEQGCLESKNQRIASGKPTGNIAHQSIQDRRALKRVPCGPGGVLHDYVPLYFAPRSPMLCAIHQGAVDSCIYSQHDIATLEFRLDDVLAAGLPFVFYDVNASTGFAQAFDDIAQLSEIDWPLFFEPPLLGGYAKYWASRPEPPSHMHRRETRQAEFLIHERLPAELVHQIGVATPAAHTRATAAVPAPQHHCVTQQPSWYF